MTVLPGILMQQILGNADLLQAPSNLVATASECDYVHLTWTNNADPLLPPNVILTAIDEDTIRLTVTSAYPTEVQVSEDGSTGWVDLVSLPADPDDYDHVIEGTTSGEMTFEGTDGADPSTVATPPGVSFAVERNSGSAADANVFKVYNNSISVRSGSSSWQACLWELDEPFPTSGEFEADLRAHVTSTAGMQAIVFGCTGDNPWSGVAMNLRAGKLRFEGGLMGGWVDYNFPFSTNTPYRMKAVWDEDEISVYIDDVLIATRAYTGPMGAQFGYLGWFTAGAVNMSVMDNVAFVLSNESPPYTRHYRARAVNGPNVSDWSAVVSGTTISESLSIKNPTNDIFELSTFSPLSPTGDQFTLQELS